MIQGASNHHRYARQESKGFQTAASASSMQRRGRARHDSVSEQTSMQRGSHAKHYAHVAECMRATQYTRSRLPARPAEGQGNALRERLVFLKVFSQLCLRPADHVDLRRRGAHNSNENKKGPATAESLDHAFNATKSARCARQARGNVKLAVLRSQRISCLFKRGEDV
eukprot:6183439-Pleurochrysis_carterae.AAC.1